MQSRFLFRFWFAALIGVSVPIEAQSRLAPQIADQPNGRENADSNTQNATVRLFREWLHAMQTADNATYLQFVKEHISGDPDQWVEFRPIARGTRLYGVKSATADGADLWLFDPNLDSFVTASAKLKTNDHNKIEIVTMHPTRERPAGAAPPPKLEDSALIKAFSARAAYYAQSDDFSGAVLLAKNGHVLFQNAYGFADREAHKPNQLNTQFRFGSMGKMFTMIGIMQLAQDGKIDLSAPIGRYLPNYPNQDVATKVTVSNLLTHTGGTGDIFGPDFKSHKASLRDLKDYVDLYGKRPLEFVPGTRFAYSNYGFILLGSIIEEVSGLTYDQYLQRNIFGPAGMDSTGNRPEGDRLPRRAVGYMGSGANLKRSDDTLPIRGTSAGGGYSTVGDFNRFAEALVSHRLLRAETLQKLISGGITGKDGTFYPYDFGSTIAGSGRFIGHSGGAPGMNGELQHFLDSGYTIVVLANRDPPAADFVGIFIAHRLPAK
jgi:CubicO group peptidase (beta-lactamase class C family)